MIGAFCYSLQTVFDRKEWDFAWLLCVAIAVHELNLWEPIHLNETNAKI